MKSTSLAKLKSGKAPKGAQHSRTCKNGIIKHAFQKLSTSKTVSNQDVKAEFRGGGAHLLELFSYIGEGRSSSNNSNTTQ